MQPRFYNLPLVSISLDLLLGITSSFVSPFVGCFVFLDLNLTVGGPALILLLTVGGPALILQLNVGGPALFLLLIVGGPALTLQLTFGGPNLPRLLLGNFSHFAR